MRDPFDETIAQRQQQRLHEFATRRKELRTAFPERALLWLALVLEWTAPLAKAAGFPTDGRPVEQLLKDIASTDLCVVTPPTSEVLFDETTGAVELVEAPASYRMAKNVSAEIVQEITETHGLPAITKEVLKIGDGILAAKKQGVTLPDSLEKWATLAIQVTDPFKLRTFLPNQVDECLQQGKLGEALRWVEAVLPLEDQLKGPLTEAGPTGRPAH